MITLYFTAAGMSVLLVQNAWMGLRALAAEARTAVPTHPTQVYPDYVYEND